MRYPVTFAQHTQSPDERSTRESAIIDFQNRLFSATRFIVTNNNNITITNVNGEFFSRRLLYVMNANGNRVYVFRFHRETTRYGVKKCAPPPSRPLSHTSYVFFFPLLPPLPYQSVYGRKAGLTRKRRKSVSLKTCALVTGRAIEIVSTRALHF